MSKRPDSVSQRYLGNDVSQSQAVPARGSVSGGSKPTPQAQRMTTGSGNRGARVTIGTSAPGSPKKHRG
jgi:hypothetical protein